MAKKQKKMYKKVRGIGFYLLFPVFILCLAAPFVHKLGFEGTQYYTEEAFWLPIIGTGIAFLVSLPKCTSKYGSLLMFLVSFASLLTFAQVAYMHLSSVFFSGIADTIPGIFEQMGFHFSFCALGYVGAMLLSILIMFLPATKYKKVKA